MHSFLSLQFYYINFVPLAFLGDICYPILLEQEKFSLLLLFLRHLRTSRGHSLSFLSLSLEYCQICHSCYACDICYAVFLINSREIVVTFAFFAKFANFSRPLIAFSLSKILSCYSCDICYSVFLNSNKKSCSFWETWELQKNLASWPFLFPSVNFFRFVNLSTLAFFFALSLPYLFLSQEIC